ncbi:hypothetical protein WDZ92_21780 [Nostoc sp. NIES-2111]
MVQLTVLVFIALLSFSCARTEPSAGIEAEQLTLDAYIAASNEIVVGDFESYGAPIDQDQVHLFERSKFALSLLSCFYLKSGKIEDKCTVYVPKSSIAFAEPGSLHKGANKPNSTYLVPVEIRNGVLVAMSSSPQGSMRLQNSVPMLLARKSQIRSQIRSYESRLIVLLLADKLKANEPNGKAAFRSVIQIGVRLLGYAELKNLILEEFSDYTRSRDACRIMLEHFVYLYQCASVLRDDEGGGQPSILSGFTFEKLRSDHAFDKWLGSAIGAYPGFRSKLDLAVSLKDVPGSEFQKVRRKWLENAALAPVD